MAGVGDDTEDSLPFQPASESVVADSDLIGPTLPPTVSVTPVTTGSDSDSSPGLAPSLADQMATRNIQMASSAAKYGLPAQRSEPVAADHFVRPELESMRHSTTAMLIGRGLMAMAMLLVGIAAQRSSGPARSERGEAFWPVAVSAAMFVAVGIAGLVFWSVTLGDNAQRLKARSASPRRMGWSWAPVLVWVAVSSLTYLRFEVDAEFDPMPGITGIVFAALLAIPYAQLQGIFRGLSRRPPLLWTNAFPLDLLAFGLVWWRLTSWPDPVSMGDTDHVQLTAYIAFGAAGALTINVIVFVVLARRGISGLYERLGRLETRHRGGKPPGAEWFATGRQLERDAENRLESRQSPLQRESD